mmetsp:Transcript_103196/g.189003  ORF Transcript_103196/g.189003 Transcript_103196/m.189003 type:complete len:392 (+) Transcript_103196:53-1228(+)
MASARLPLLLIAFSTAVSFVEAEENDTAMAAEELMANTSWSASSSGVAMNATGDLMTTLSMAANAGDTTLYLTDVTGVAIGWSIVLEHPDGFYSETVSVTGVTVGSRRLSSEGRRLASGSVTIPPPLANSYPSGAGVAASAPAASGSVGNDPVVWFGKEAREFWLPVGQLTPIIQTRHLNMYASTFVGSPREQWIDRIVVTNSDGFRFADVRIKKSIASFNRSKILKDGFESLDVTFGMEQSPRKVMPKATPTGSQEAHARMDLWMVVEPLSKVFNWLPYAVDQTHIGKARREAIIITSPDVRFLIISSPATEYSGDFSYLSVEYAHLDVHILEMKHQQSVRGLLPELWGIQKMSNMTKELTCPPWSKDAPQTKRYAVDVDAEWNRRFFTV